jgi:hypothetical protein
MLITRMITLYLCLTHCVFSAELAVLAATAVLTVYLPLPTSNRLHHAVIASLNNLHISCFLTDSNRVLVVY